MTQKWLKSNSDMAINLARLAESEAELLEQIKKDKETLRISDQRRAELASTVSERDKMITTLTNEINGLKNDVEGLQNEVNVLADRAKFLQEANERQLLIIRDLKAQNSLINLIKKWLKL